jgi:hypothetical protein
VYSLIIGMHHGFYEVKVGGGERRMYASLAMLLQYWQPASHPYAERDSNGQTLADKGIAFS